jgi:hypothetical protein
LPSDTATPGAYTFCPALAMATTPKRLKSRKRKNEAKPTQIRLLVHTNTWIHLIGKEGGGRT